MAVTGKITARKDRGALRSFDGDGTGMDRQSDQATSQLRTLIITGELEPGSTIEEAAISKRLGCGRTPIREALMRLAEERLVVIQPRRAVSVSPISLVDLRQIVEARCPLEMTAVQLATERITPAQIEGLEEMVDGLTSKDDLRSLRVVEMDYGFHFQLARASGNRYLADSVGRLLGAAMRLTFCADARGVPIEPMRAEHIAILDAVKLRDAKKAAARMRQHIFSAKDRIIEAL